jgi:hypothetical protein
MIPENKKFKTAIKSLFSLQPKDSNTQILADLKMLKPAFKD